MILLIEELMLGTKTPEGMTANKPLEVYIATDPNGVLGIFSNDNRRLVTYKMIQSTNNETLTQNTTNCAMT